MVKKKISINALLKQEILKISPDKESMNSLKRMTKGFLKTLNEELIRARVDAEAFVGGSFARGTLVKQDVYDVDVFVRFDWRYVELSKILDKILKKVSKKLNLRMERIHGSRDYFKLYHEDGKGYFEIIPVTKIKKPQEERNVTDLSYFHVPYVKRKIKGLENDVRLAKVFFKAQKVYGAETYVSGFSGYVLELLIIHYCGFLKMLRALSKVKVGERLVIDTAKHYKRKNDIFIEMNEAKLHSPIILIDPTYSGRNALAALSFKTFRKFQEVSKKFLEKPDEKFFIKQEINVDKMKRKAKKDNAEFLELRMETDKQSGDIAGTKLKKFAENLIEDLRKNYEIKEFEFEYGGEKEGRTYLIVKSKKEIIRIGPPIHLKKFVRRFKKEHMNTFEKNRMIHAKIKINFTAKSYVDIWIKSNKKKIEDMSIRRIKIF